MTALKYEIFYNNT